MVTIKNSSCFRRRYRFSRDSISNLWLEDGQIIDIPGPIEVALIRELVSAQQEGLLKITAAVDESPEVLVALGFEVPAPAEPTKPTEPVIPPADPVIPPADPVIPPADPVIPPAEPVPAEPVPATPVVEAPVAPAEPAPAPVVEVPAPVEELKETGVGETIADVSGGVTISESQPVTSTDSQPVVEITPTPET